VDEIKMNVNIDVRSIKSSEAEEIYILATPLKKMPADELWREIFTGIRNTLISCDAYIIQERIFGTEDALIIAYEERLVQFSDIDDKVAPSFLVCKEGLTGPVSGVQIHAIKCNNKPEVIDFQNHLCGRVVNVPGRTYLTMSSISAPNIDNLDKQAKAMLEKAEAILRNFGIDFSDVPRTWMWLGNILTWYDSFNQVRNNFFAERGLITEKGIQALPASTGIGLSSLNNGNCSMDLVAVIKPSKSFKYLSSTGRQYSAFEYGSAFSRATVAVTPVAETVYVSGTASIDLDGRTTNIDDPLGQINETILNVRSALKDVNCRDDDIIQAVAYCKTPEVEKIFNSVKSDLNWPCLSVVCDICRPELLFEIEATAVVPFKS
jgi:enamine deaminase RidA (YjgF/YER057c/UK114 family)